ncbi:tetratricopeptide repeat protein [Flavobacteriales bacterium]|nr:tetratricopeptide repeat protein [Flavobacteriales bacterium]MDC0015079.1 tetratricopeptide repeat protein [Flavobacteriales bacterium]
MKRILLSILIGILSFGAMAQKGNLGDKPDECRKYLSLYGDYLKQEMFNDAYRFWVQAVNVCPEYNANLYENGVYIMDALKATATPERKVALTDSIVWAYKQSIKLFGDNPTVNESFGLDMIKSGRIEEGVDLIDKALDSNANGVGAETIYYYSIGLAKLKNKSKRDCDVLVEEYDRLSEVIEFNGGTDGYDFAQGGIDKYLGPCLTCDKLLPVIEKKFEEAKTDDNTRSKVLNTLNKRGCTDNPIYEALTIIEAEKNPSSEAFGNIAQTYINKKDYKKAVEYYNKAIELTQDASEKEELLINAAKAMMNSGQRSKAGSYADKVLAINPNNGDAYLIKASNIARSKCGTSAFEDKAINWAAYDMAAKAKSVDPSVASQAAKDMAAYRARFPSDTELFEQGLSKGSAYKTCNGYSTTVK